MSRPDFDFQPELVGDTLRLRPLKHDDFAGLYSAASHPQIWAGHPAKDRHKKEVFEPYFLFLLESGTTLVIIDQQTGQIIGCSRYYVSPDQPDSIAIGFTFLNHAYWGGTTNLELKRLMLDHAFEQFPEVWFHIAPSNVRSQKATAKLGAEHIYDATVDLSGAPAAWMCFRLKKDVWRERHQTRLP
ncbi:GNAT family N-acetyltransferase [Mesorhizobium sp. KR1-2]|uniref:GNAT family N-acetyltransferase n=1 Tax=Mesorhizobium sp. KR1-2 TaxID=3156609 RepID=UPI0032B32AC7